jgi:uncharacterized protein YqiB (DUF1249 family)
MKFSSFPWNVQQHFILNYLHIIHLFTKLVSKEGMQYIQLLGESATELKITESHRVTVGVRINGRKPTERPTINWTEKNCRHLLTFS